MKAKTLDDLRAVHDDSVVVPTKIRARFAAMLKAGPEEHDYEQKFLKDAGVANNKISEYRAQFKAHIVKLPGNNGKRIWFGDAKVASKFRTTIGATADVE